MSGAWSWEYAARVLPPIAAALRITVLATVLGSVLAMTLGLVWAVARRSGVRALAWPAGLAVEFLRSTPLLVQLFFLYYALPRWGISVGALGTGVLALGLHYSAYASEVYRAGIESVPRGQWEAARALNFSPVHTWTRIVVPQAIPPVVPALGNYVVAMFKDTPLLSAITVVEMLRRAMILGNRDFRYLEPLTIVGVLFLVVSLLTAWGVRALEARLRLEPAAR